MTQPIPRKKYIWVLCLSAGVFLLALALALLLSRGAGSDTVERGEHPLRIAEYMSSNSAFPNPEGLFCDWVEIENNADRAFNISGYRLSDDFTQARFAFPVGTVIPAGGRVVVWCTPERSGGMYAPFSMKSQGGETLLLMNSANTVLDRVDTLRCPRNMSVVRREDGSLLPTDRPTPGFANNDGGFAAFMSSQGLGTGEVRLSEILSASKLYIAPNGQPADWIEVENAGPETADLGGLRLSDKEGEARYVFPPGATLAPGERRVIWCTGDESQGEDCAAFRLAKQGETVILSDAQGVAIDRVVLPFMLSDTAMARISGEWVVTDRPTPGYANDEEGYARWVASLGFSETHVILTEIAPQNTAGLRDADGEAKDWIELYNGGTERVSLEGWFLSDDPAKPAKWRLGPLELAPGEYAVIFASRKDRREGEQHTDFAVSAGETVSLVTPAGTVADQVECPLVGENHVWARGETGDWAESGRATPGRANG